MFKLTNIYPSVLLLLMVLFFAACENSVAHETCGGQPVCPPPADDKSPENIKKLRTDIAGKWKFVSLFSRDTFHKTEQKYTTQKSSLCVSYDGGIQFFRDYTDFVCAFCYELQSSGDTLRLKIDETGLSKYCTEQLQTGDVTVRNDSLIIIRRDSFILKNIVYKRMNDDGSFKTQN